MRNFNNFFRFFCGFWGSREELGILRSLEVSQDRSDGTEAALNKDEKFGVRRQISINLL